MTVKENEVENTEDRPYRASVTLRGHDWDFIIDQLQRAAKRSRSNARDRAYRCDLLDRVESQTTSRRDYL